jgi:hypothetical protein
VEDEKAQQVDLFFGVGHISRWGALEGVTGHDAPKENHMIDITSLETRLNARIQEGKILEALDEYFADDASFQEGLSKPRVGKAANHEFLEGFFKTLKGFNGATLHAQAVNGNISFSEWTFDMVGPEGPIIWNEVLRREWKNGKVISERYYNTAS